MPDPEEKNLSGGKSDSEKPSPAGENNGDRYDVSIGEVGEGSQIAIGSSITQIGSQVVNVFKANLWPVLVMLLITLLGVGAILFLMLRPEDQGPMPGLFNIAVAAFDERRDGQGVDSREGRQTAILLAEELARQLPERDFLVWGPLERDMRVSGEGPEERFEEAGELSDILEAHVVIYGLIERDNSITIRPHILIDLESFVLGEELLGEELDGAYQLGPPIFFAEDLDVPGVERELRDILAGRAAPLAHFALGLDSYRTDDFGNALDSFTLAEEAARSWESPEGKGVIYLFLGAAELNLGITTGESGHFEAAHDWFEEAVSENEAYARAHLGHGFTYLQEANLIISRDAGQQSDIVALLEEAEQAFREGQQASFKPPNGDVDAKANFGLGRAYFLITQFGDRDLLDDAEDAFVFVIDRFRNGNQRLQELAARSYGWLGLLNFHRIRDEEAIMAYQCALQLGRYETLKNAWTERLDELCLENDCQPVIAEGVCDGSAE